MDKVYCAVYTRKSSSEGLEGGFTTLDAQREAALNYIASQKSQGWVALPQQYDDGGFTGANMDRPAMQKLLEDIKKGGIDCVVVYKVDRLSRSLVDFARLLELFEKHKVMFVSITQNFNTTSSMGRLTLNILLSFAQFEREIISERTKDKMAAARKKGRWVGGNAPLGYDVDREAKALVVNKAEAKLVREVFDLYLKKRVLLDVAKTLNDRGLLTKRHKWKGGICGGKPFDKNSVAYIIKSRVYVGQVAYAGGIYAGCQEAIVPLEIFEEAQKSLAESRVHRVRPNSNERTALLRHILWCANCKTRMIPTYATKEEIKYRYYRCYTTYRKRKRAHECPTGSLNADQVESAVLEKVVWIADNAPELKGKNILVNTPAWDLLFPQERRRVLDRLVASVKYDGISKKLAVEIDEAGVRELERELARCSTNS